MLGSPLPDWVFQKKGSYSGKWFTFDWAMRPSNCTKIMEGLLEAESTRVRPEHVRRADPPTPDPVGGLTEEEVKEMTGHYRRDGSKPE